MWNGGKRGEDDLLAGCYRTALELAAANGLHSIAFPAISTGVYRFPADRAAQIAVGTVVSELSADPRGIERVVFCCFSQGSAKHHMHAFAELDWRCSRSRHLSASDASLEGRRPAVPPHPSRRRDAHLG